MAAATKNAPPDGLQSWFSGSSKSHEQTYHWSTYMTSGRGDQSSQTGEKTASTGMWNHTQALPPKMGSVGVLF